MDNLLSPLADRRNQDPTIGRSEGQGEGRGSGIDKSLRALTSEVPGELEDLGLSEADWQAIDVGQHGTPPNAAEWAVYFRRNNGQGD